MIVDVQCKRRKLFGGGEKVVVKPYHLPASSYDDMILNSTFGFSPGGSSVGSYRFGEILSTGGIPVVTHDVVPPLHPDVNWNDCIYRVSEAQIVDLPRLLRLVSAAEVKERQQACWQLFQNVFGDRKEEGGGKWQGDERVTFTKALQVWALRVANALEKEKQSLVLNPGLSSLA